MTLSGRARGLASTALGLACLLRHLPGEAALSGVASRAELSQAFGGCSPSLEAHPLKAMLYSDLSRAQASDGRSQTNHAGYAAHVRTRPHLYCLPSRRGRRYEHVGPTGQHQKRIIIMFVMFLYVCCHCSTNHKSRGPSDLRFWSCLIAAITS
uniref:Secreted protein n=1 Tax=Ixodes ricinus TaxID=34613 RepID=A0A6B0UWD5_IXORI